MSPRLTPGERRIIRLLYRRSSLWDSPYGWHTKTLARRFGVSERMISNVLHEEGEDK